MILEQAIILLIVALLVGGFLWGRWRHDLVAVGALIACVITGLVSTDAAFGGFGHPAVITVACVLIMSKALQMSGAVDVIARLAIPSRAGPTLSLAALMGIGALLSGFMNNVGAMALLMPVALKTAARLDLPPGRLLMPLAFGTILGGMTTLIGTPPNLIVSGYRSTAGTGSGPFGMFDFSAIGVPVAVLGIVFIALVGWRLVPSRKQAGIEGFDTGAYLTEARIIEGGASAGKTLGETEKVLEEAGAQVVGLVRNEMRINAPNPQRTLLAGDILVIEATADTLATLLSSLGLRLEESRRPDKPGEEEEGSIAEPGDDEEDDASTPAHSDASAEIVLIELVVLPGASLAGRSATDINLRTRYGLNLLAVSRQGNRSIERLRALAMRPGDILLLQGPPAAISAFANDTGCVPLAERDLLIPNKRKALLTSLIMLFAVGVAAAGWLPAAISFMAGVLVILLLRLLPLRQVYEAVDWPVIVLLGALFPVAEALQSTGAADLVARALMGWIANGDATIALALVLVITMFLSDVMNNAATAAVMCPVAIGSASTLGVDPDAFLMAVAIGASCAFLTPIGHQNNTLILGPGGFRFGDYWKLGLPLELLVVAISLPLLHMVWPLH